MHHFHHPHLALINPRTVSPSLSVSRILFPSVFLSPLLSLFISQLLFLKPSRQSYPHSDMLFSFLTLSAFSLHAVSLVAVIKREPAGMGRASSFKEVKTQRSNQLLWSQKLKKITGTEQARFLLTVKIF